MPPTDPMPQANPSAKTADAASAEPTSMLQEILRVRRSSSDDPRQRSSANALDQMYKEMEEGKIVYEPGIDTGPKIAQRIATYDKQIQAQLNLILHHPDFQKLEASWRGLHQLVSHAGDVAGSEVKLKLMNVSKVELAKDLSRAFDRSELWAKIYAKEYDTYGGDPFAAMIGDYEFTNHPEDINLLKKIAGVAAAAHAPFLSAAGAGLFGWDEFRQNDEIHDLSKIFERGEYANWRSFREMDDAKYVGLCLPRYLLRLPYGSKTVPVKSFAFEEDVNGTSSKNYLWGNAAYALATRLVESYALYHWCATIRGPESGGKVKNLPIHNFETDAKTFDNKCPIEIALDGRRDREFSELGFIPFTHCKGEDHAVFFKTNSCHKPPKFSTDEANANARLGMQLQYIMATSRIAHYLKVIATRMIGSFTSWEQLEKDLNKWIREYVTDDDTAPFETKAKFPLRDAEIRVVEEPGKPGCYKAVAFLRPHFQLDELTMSLELVAQLPEKK